MTSAIDTLSNNAVMALGQGQAAPKTGKTGDLAAARKSAQNFEAFFASQMLEQMFADVKTDSLFGGGHGEEMFRSLLLDAYGKQIAAHGGLGVSDAIMRSLTAQQEVKS